MSQGPNIAAWSATVSVLMLVTGGAGRVAAQEADAAAEVSRYLVVRPAFFFSNTDGVTALRGQRSGTIEMEDSVLAVNWAGQLEYHEGRFGVLGDVSYSTTSNTAALDPSGVPAVYDFSILTSDLAIGYQFGDLGDRAQMLLLLGARYFRTEQRLADSASGAALGTFRDDWLQPLVGARGLVRLANPLNGWTRFDLGVRPAASGHAALSWLLHVGLDYWMLRRAGVTLQYRYLQLDTGAPGGRSVAYDGPSQGWIVGLSVRL